jgi:hypothetical protein
VETDTPSSRLATSNHHWGLEKLIERFNIEIMKVDADILGLFFALLMPHWESILHFYNLKFGSVEGKCSLNVFGISLIWDVGPKPSWNTQICDKCAYWTL